uniref:sn-1-specific diacylglycerol lipase ABHD11 n=2 Tax=Macaca TaxID=9539 RepID=A0A2K5VX54_MACFA
MGAGRGRGSSRNWAGLKTELGGAPSESGRRSVGRPYLARCEPDNVLASMLRCTRAWRLPLEGLGPHSPSFARVPVAPSSSGGRGEAEPRSVRGTGREAPCPPFPAGPRRPHILPVASQASPPKPFPLPLSPPPPVQTLTRILPLPGRFRFPTAFWTGRQPSRPSFFCTGSSAAKLTSTPSPRPSPSRQDVGDDLELTTSYGSPFFCAPTVGNSWSLVPGILRDYPPAWPALQRRGHNPGACSSLAEWPQVLTVDARNHGNSPHSPDMSYEIMSQDLQDLLPQLDLVPCVVVGHSMGGRTAMLLALQRPELVERLIAVDISPVEGTGSSHFPAYVAAMRTVNIPDGLPRSHARKLADEQLSSVVQNLAVRQYLLTNLVEVDGRLAWRLNLDALAQHLDKLLTFPQRQESYLGPTLFLLGGNSQFVHPSHHPEIIRLFPRAQIQTVPNAGHWIHAERPQDFIDAIRGFLV